MIPAKLRRLTCAFVASLVCASVARAELKEDVKGYKDYRFGMSTKEAITSSGADCENFKKYVVCHIPGPDLLEQSTRLALWFFEDKLSKVIITFSFPKDMPASERVGKYFELNRTLGEKYGAADNVTEKGRTVGDVTFGGATFTRYWYGPGKKTSINTMMWGDDDHEVCLIVSYADRVNTTRAIEAQQADREKARQADSENL